MGQACFPARASDKITAAFLRKPVLQRTGCFPQMGPDNMLIGFGGYVGRLRNEKGLSYRQLGQLAGIDHASLQQLEGGEKKDLSDDMVNSLIRVLSPGKRKTRMLRFLLSTPVDEHLLGQVLEDPEISLDDFESAAHMCAPSRPSGREAWRCILTQVRSSREKMKRG
jgi:transcriptional regulator with XRE-family HTH domain